MTYSPASSRRLNWPDSPGVRFSFSPRIRPSCITSASVTRPAPLLVMAKLSGARLDRGRTGAQPSSVKSIFTAPEPPLVDPDEATSDLAQPVTSSGTAAVMAIAARKRRRSWRWKAFRA